MFEQFLNEIFQTQNIFRYFFLFIILSNFLIIITLRFEINQGTKLKQMFNIESIKNDISKIKSVLIIIAHPDDEIMFFTPTIKYLIKIGIKIKILCLSNGNYDKIGEIRTEEFKNVSKYLKLEDNELINIPELQDDIKKFWNEKIVSDKISDFLIRNNDIETILTFDENGVTKHPNHISCYNGLVYYIKNNREDFKKKGINVYLLDSFNPLFQYTFFIPFLSYYLREFGFSTWNFLSSYKIMSIYNSQFNWRRKLHVIFSGYSYCNSFIKVELK